MIRIKYYATEREDLVSHLSHDDESPISIKPLSEIEDKIKKSTPIFNFASFFGGGIDLYDETVELGGEDDYYGFVPQRTVSDQSVVISFPRHTGEEAPWLDNGITIEFNKHTCRKITVERNGAVLGTAEAEDGEYLSEKVHIAFTTPEESWADVNVVFSDFPENAPINLRGVVLGKVVNVDDIMSFDMITETNPISDDLALNETNVTAVIEEDFTSYEGQKVIMYDNDEVLENGILKSSEETDTDLYNLKSRNTLQKFDKEKTDYFRLYGFDSTMDFNDEQKTVKSILSELGLDVEISEDVSQQYISQYLKQSTKRQILQQIAWASCCGVDTTYYDKPKLIPFFAVETPEDEIITISNADDKILKTSVTNGEKYSKIIWKKTKYIKGNDFEPLDSPNEVPYNEKVGKRYLEVETDYPVAVFTDSNNFSVYNITPYKYAIEALFDNDEDVSSFSANVLGFKYTTKEELVEISTGIKNGSTLEITNQTLYPIDDTKKIAQIKKWYSNNNTLSATIVDNDSQIRLGKVIKIELKKPGTFFQGIVTKIIRNNISTYHTVELEAHEWN